MSDETPKPKCKRWRWIIAGVLLFVVGVAGWWYWPRVDSRFVGNWQVTAEEANRSHGRLELKADGTGLVVVREKTGYGIVQKVYGFDWRMEGNSLAVYRENKTRFQLWNRLMRQAYEYTKSPVFLGRDRFSLDRSDGDRLDLSGSREQSQGPFFPASFSITRVHK